MKNLSRKRAANTYITGLNSFVLPVNSFNSTYDNNPKTIPSAILKVSGIIITAKKTGIDSVKSSKFTFKIGLIINDPTKINAGAVAAAGTIKNRGAKNKAKKNIAAVVNEVKPVLPPSDTPEALSI